MTLNFKQGEVHRNELELPSLHFVVMDNWIDVIGEKAFIAWLKMFTWCDRRTVKDNPSLWNESVIPKSLNKVMKDLGVGRTTFYNKILKPLWNVGLIDLVEFEDSKQSGTKPINIIVYKYPQNKYELSVKPLEVIRDYDNDYNSNSKTFAQMKKYRTESVRGGVPNQYGGVYQNSTGARTESVHNNILNNINNNLNNILINDEEEEEKTPKPGNPISNEPKPGNPISGNPKTSNQDNNNIKDTNIDLTNIDEDDEEEKRFSDEGNSELVEFLLKNNITEENAIAFEKGCLELGLIDFDKETALKAIEWSLIQFKEGKCYEPYKYAAGRLKRLLDVKLKEVGIKSVVGNKQIKTEKIPDWFYKRNEERNDVENDEKINFEAERQKILAKLYS